MIKPERESRIGPSKYLNVERQKGERTHTHTHTCRHTHSHTNTRTHTLTHTHRLDEKRPKPVREGGEQRRNNNNKTNCRAHSSSSSSSPAGLVSLSLSLSLSFSTFPSSSAFRKVRKCRGSAGSLQPRLLFLLERSSCRSCGDREREKERCWPTIHVAAPLSRFSLSLLFFLFVLFVFVSVCVFTHSLWLPFRGVFRSFSNS